MKSGRKAWFTGSLTLAAVLAGLAIPTWYPTVHAEQATGAEQITDDAAKAADDRVPTTTISAQEMSYDVDKRVSTYSGTVHIAHDDVELFADRMIVTHGPDNSPTRIQAVGAVRISKGDKLATSEVAVYHVNRQEIVLTGNPSMQQGLNSLAGADSLIFSQKDGRFRTAGGRVHLKVVNDTDTKWLSGSPAGETEPASTPDSPHD